MFLMRPSVGLPVLAAHYPIKIHLCDAPDHKVIESGGALPNQDSFI
jgi:hypothetical protein